jgi:5-methylcytosine-specific restriction endonuclease McrA
MPRERHKLWIGRNDRAMPPENVQLRILERYKACCAGCQRKLMMGERWELDHVIALQDGGVNAEGNLQPLCKPCHGVKTGAEATIRAKVRAKTKAAYGIKTAKQKIRSAGFPKRAERTQKQPLMARSLYGPGGWLMPAGNGEDYE